MSCLLTGMKSASPIRRPTSNRCTINHAVRYYDLHSNPAAKAGNMGNEERREMLFWTKEEYQKFSEVMMDKPVSYYAFQMLYWTGIREGELLALTPADFDFEHGTVKISKTYQRFKGEDIITSPKTKKSNRTIQMPEFLCTQMQEFFKMPKKEGPYFYRDQELSPPRNGQRCQDSRC